MWVSISGFISEEIFYLQQIILSKVKLSGIRSAFSRAILRTLTLKVYSLHDRISTLFTKITNLPSILIQTEIIIHNIGITMLKDFLCSQSDQHVDLEKVTNVPVWEHSVFVTLVAFTAVFISRLFAYYVLPKQPLISFSGFSNVELYYFLCILILSLFGMGFFGAAHGWGR